MRVRCRGFDSRLRSPISVAALVHRVFRRAVDNGLSGKVPHCRTSGFELRAIGQPIDSHVALCPSPFSTGRRIGLSLITTRSPVRVRPSAPLCRSSSVAEHVHSQFVSYPSVLFSGRRLWVIGTRRWRFNSAPWIVLRWCNGSTPGNSTVAFLSARF